MVREVVVRYFPALWPAVEAGLSTAATLLLKDNSNPVALILVGPSGAGKTTVASMFDDSQLKDDAISYRTDKFTAAAWVSQSARQTNDELKKVDMLCRVRHKLFLTPELATVFRGEDDVLTDRFSIITRVLDGQGLTTDSAVHGQRGYTGDYMMAWLGCTTPFEPKIWQIMAQLGSRLLFYDLKSIATATVTDLIHGMTAEQDGGSGDTECQQVVCGFLNHLFATSGGVRGVVWQSKDTPLEVMYVIGHCAKLIATLRTPVPAGDEIPIPESPHRVSKVLYNLARGRAIVYGRRTLSTEDLPMIAHVALSSIPERRKGLLQAFIATKGKPLTVNDIEKAALTVRKRNIVEGVSRHTAENLMNEVEMLGFGKVEKRGKKGTQYLHLAAEWQWIVSEDFAPYLAAS
jgi:hypothetical protein